MTSPLDSGLARRCPAKNTYRKEDPRFAHYTSAPSTSSIVRCFRANPSVYKRLIGPSYRRWTPGGGRFARTADDAIGLRRTAHLLSARPVRPPAGVCWPVSDSADKFHSIARIRCRVELEKPAASVAAACASLCRFNAKCRLARGCGRQANGKTRNHHRGIIRTTSCYRRPSNAASFRKQQRFSDNDAARPFLDDGYEKQNGRTDEAPSNGRFHHQEESVSILSSICSRRKWPSAERRLCDDSVAK